jgi:hypothetical protein
MREGTICKFIFNLPLLYTQWYYMFTVILDWSHVFGQIVILNDEMMMLLINVQITTSHTLFCKFIFNGFLNRHNIFTVVKMTTDSNFECLMKLCLFKCLLFTSFCFNNFYFLQYTSSD